MAQVLLRLLLAIDSHGTIPMKVICSWCKIEGRPAMIGEKEPFRDRGETHSICLDHMRQLNIDQEESAADAPG